jgi:AcrR family transcriptional regulator
MPLTTFFNLPEEKRQKILACALEEFGQHDFDSASISKIVARAGISKGSLYQYFADKGDLYQFLLELARQKKTELMVSAQQPEGDFSVFSTLRSLFKVMATFELRYPQLAKVGYRALHGKSPLPEEVLVHARRSTQTYFIDLIAKGKQQGEIRKDVDARTAAFILSAALEQLGTLIMAEHATEELPVGVATEVENSYNEILSILRDGIVSKEGDNHELRS